MTAGLPPAAPDPGAADPGLEGGRNPLVAGMLAAFLGTFGAQYFYEGRLAAAILSLVFCWTGIPLFVGLFGSFGRFARARRELRGADATAATALTVGVALYLAFITLYIAFFAFIIAAALLAAPGSGSLPYT